MQATYCEATGAHCKVNGYLSSPGIVWERVVSHDTINSRSKLGVVVSPHINSAKLFLKCTIVLDQHTMHPCTQFPLRIPVHRKSILHFILPNHFSVSPTNTENTPPTSALSRLISTVDHLWGSGLDRVISETTVLIKAREMMPSSCRSAVTGRLPTSLSSRDILITLPPGLCARKTLSKAYLLVPRPLPGCRARRRHCQGFGLQVKVDISWWRLNVLGPVFVAAWVWADGSVTSTSSQM